MARKYAKLYVETWDAASDFRDLTAAAQRLYLMLCSLPQLTPAGVLPLQPKKWARLASDTNERGITKALQELADAKKVLVDEHTDEVLVRAFIRRDEGVRTPNIRKAITRAIESIESTPLRKAADRELRRTAQALGVTLGEGSPEPLPEGLGEGMSERTPPPTEDLKPSPPRLQTTSPSHPTDEFKSISTAVGELLDGKGRR